MAGFLIPLGQTLGPAIQQKQIEQTNEQRYATQQQAASELLNSLGPEYEPFRRALKSGAPADWVMQQLGGPIGSRIKEQQVRDQLTKSFGAAAGTPGKNPQVDLLRSWLASGLITPEQYLTQTAKLQAETDPKGEQERWIYDQFGMTPEQYRGLPPEAKTALDQAFVNHKPQRPLLIQEADPTLGINVMRPYTPTGGGLVPTPIIGGAATGAAGTGAAPASASPAGGFRRPYSPNELDALTTFQTARSALMAASKQLEGVKGEVSGKPGVAAAGALAYKLGVPLKRGDLYTQLRFAQATLIGAAMRAAGTRAIRYAMFIQDHYPSPYFADESNRQRINAWLRPGGLLDIIDNSIRKGAPLPPLASVPGIDAKEAAPYDSGAEGSATSTVPSYGDLTSKYRE